MKRSILMLLVIGVAMIFFGCEKMDPLVPDSNIDQEITSLKAAKVRTFTGTCIPIDVNPPIINKWYDEADEWRVTGTTLWTQPDPDVFEGTAELFVDIGKPNGVPKGNPEGVFRGKWEITWDGIQTPIMDADEMVGLKIVCDAYGIGKEGAVKGLVAEWTYTMNLLFADEANTFYYETEGFIKKDKD